MEGQEGQEGQEGRLCMYYSVRIYCVACSKDTSTLPLSTLFITLLRSTSGWIWMDGAKLCEFQAYFTTPCPAF